MVRVDAVGGRPATMQRGVVYGQTYLDLNTTPPPIAWQMLRMLRADPPGRAGGGDRKKTFNMALEQAEQLLGAALTVGPAARPLLAFYGLSQAGRAVAAAAQTVSNNEYRLEGHGIRTGEMQGVMNTGLAALTVTDQGKGSFTKLANFLGAASLPEATPIGELWGLLPDLSRFPLPGMGTMRPVSIETSPTTVRAHDVPVSIRGIPQDLAYTAPGSGGDPDVDASGYAEERQRVIAFLDRYPSLTGWEFRAPDGNPIGLHLVGNAAEVPVAWPNAGYGEAEDEVLDRHTIEYRGYQRLAFPVVGGASEPAHPFLLWWAILYALSMLARYEPKVWGSLININESPDAAAIEHCLEQALHLLPELIHRTIAAVAG
ncbi:YaaC family protein [Amycolatopsis sp. NPDC051903]|uniref:YaaC family protein n=1 Tax=Amycolatopsis sp. NPDC051903 TaxID=3363936 RepID=UPI0037890190